VKETKKTNETGPLDESVGLEKAFFLNQEIWRGRNRFGSISSPTELPVKFTWPVYDAVIGKFEKYISEFHLKQRPLAGYSILPEVPFNFDSPYYFPNIGKLRPFKLFNEFGTDWLSNMVFSGDPLNDNFYLESVEHRLSEKKISTVEDLLLVNLINGIKDGSFSTRDVTEIFAKILISGDMSFTRELMIEFSQSDRYRDITMPVSEYDLIDQLSKMTQALKKRQLLKPSLFIANSIVQVTLGSLGQSWIPGIVNLSGRGLRKNILAHEYIHSLGYHEISWAGLPISGYKTIKI
jgi:hypothetical protein